MKMMSSTSTTSTSGVMLMSERGPFLAPTSIPMRYFPFNSSAASWTPFSFALEARSSTGRTAPYSVFTSALIMTRLPSATAPFIASMSCSGEAGCLSLSMYVFPSAVTLTKSGSGPCALFWTAFRALGSSTLFPRWSMGVTTMKMIRSTSTTSTSGVMLMSERTPDFAPMSIAMGRSSGLGRRRPRGGGGGGGGGGLLVRARVRQRLVEPAFLEEEVDQLVGGVGDVHRHLLHPVRQVVEHHQRGDGDEQAERRGHQRLGDAGRHRGEAAGAGGRHQLEGGDDAEHRAQKPHEGSGRGDGRQPGQAAAQVGRDSQGGSFDGSVDGLDQVEFAYVVRPLVREGLASAVVLGDPAAQHPGDVAVLERVGHAGRLDQLMAGEQVAQLLRVPAALLLGAGEREEPLGHHAQRIDGHDPEDDHDQAGGNAHGLPHPEDTEICATHNGNFLLKPVAAASKRGPARSEKAAETTHAHIGCQRG